MSIRVASFFIPNAPSIPFLLEDIYLRGGYRIVNSKTVRDSLHPATKKPGMLVHTQDDGITWQLMASGEWREANFGKGGSSVIAVDPIYHDVTGALGINADYIIPVGGNTGDVLTRNTEGKAEWRQFVGSGEQGVRYSLSYTPEETVVPGSFHDFSVEMSKTSILLRVDIDVALIKLEGFGSILRDEMNPYTFISRPEQLFDNGSSVTQGGEIVYGKRYSIVSNLEETPTNVIYWRVTNIGNIPVTPTVNITYLTLE